MRDLRLAARALRRTPGFTIAAIGSLAIGFALSASVVTVVNAYLIRSMPFPSADRLYHVNYSPPGQSEPRGVSALDWSEFDDVIDVVDRSMPGRLYVREERMVEERWGLFVTRGMLEEFGGRPVLGRSFGDEDFGPGAERVLLISHDWWQSRFAADPGVVGQLVRASPDDQSGAPDTFRIVGVLPPGFRYAREYARDVKFAVPRRTEERPYMVRLREGMRPDAVEARLTNAVRRIAPALPPDWTGVHLEGVQARYLSSVRPILTAMLTGAGLVLVITCLNVCVLGLLRAMRRQKEVAVRVALGAGRGHIARALVIEAGLICAVAMAMGLSATALAMRALSPVIETQLGRPIPGGSDAMRIDATVLMLAVAAGIIVACALAGAAWIAPWRHRLRDALARDGRSGMDHPASQRIRSALVVCQIAGTLALVVGCGLMIETVRNLLNTDLGFSVDRLSRARIVLPSRTYTTPQELASFYERLMARVGPDAPVALASLPPFFEPPRQRLEIDESDTAGRMARVLTVGVAYFRLLEIDLVEGRAFTDADRVGAEPVAIVGRSLAGQLWPESSPIGKRLRTAEQSPSNSPLTAWRTVVGIAEDVQQTYNDADQNDVYLPFLQAPSHYTTVYATLDAPSPDPFTDISSLVVEIDPTALLTGTLSVEGEAEMQLARPRFLTSLLTGFALFAAVLAVLGIYGVTAYSVQQREREIAVRLALGASAGTVTSMFVKRGLIVLAAGIGLGLVAALGMAGLLRNQLYGVEGLDAPTLGVACLLMGVTGLAAIWWPSQRAARRSPATALNES